VWHVGCEIVSHESQICGLKEGNAREIRSERIDLRRSRVEGEFHSATRGETLSTSPICLKSVMILETNLRTVFEPCGTPAESDFLEACRRRPASRIRVWLFGANKFRSTEHSARWRLERSALAVTSQN
jgi:hypothetical protein